MGRRKLSSLVLISKLELRSDWIPMLLGTALYSSVAIIYISPSLFCIIFQSLIPENWQRRRRYASAFGFDAMLRLVY